MLNIARTKDLLARAEAALADAQQEAAAKPDSFFRKIALRSAQAHTDELRRDLVVEMTKRGVELIEIRLIGESAQFGSLPMSLLGRISTTFEEALVQAGRALRQQKQTVESIRSLFDMRLKRVAPGSTRLFITVQTHPDLFGFSLAEACLAETFSLLSVTTPADAQAGVRRFGKKGTQNLSKLLKTLKDNKLETHINWESPADEAFNWEGKLGRIQELSQTFDQIVANEPEEITLEGHVYMESLNKRFAIEDMNGQIFNGTVPDGLMSSLTALHVGESCEATLLESVRVNPTTGQEQKKYELKYIGPISTSFNSPVQLTLL